MTNNPMNDELNKAKADLIEKMTVEHVPEEPADEVPLIPGAWGVGQVWNKALLTRGERERVPRDYIYASELGKPLVDIWLNLRATPYTNVSNARSLRKFEAGNIFEWIIQLILVRAGILVASQERVEHQYPGMIRVSGRLDFIGGGHPDFEKARTELEGLMLPDVFMRAGRDIIAYIEETYPNGLENKVIEVKSAGAFMFEKHLKSKKGGENHRKQTMHYLVGKNLATGELLYVCRDDLRLMEVPISNPGPVLDEYKAEIARITEAMKSETQPAIEPLIVFSEDEGRFSKNWGVEYSQYLTMLYGFERPDQYVDQVAPVAARFNRVMGRLKKGDKMTPKNLEALEEMKSYGFDPDAIVAKFDASDEEEAEA